ncbi:MAG: DNA polymerase III subunit alpha [Thermomicrobiales bacterium]
MAEFAHLHLHTEYSLLDGMGRTKEYAKRAAELDLQHIAVTDHGVMYGAMEWYKTAAAAGLHPIIGVEAYLAEGSAKNRERKSYHLLLLAENETGYRNLLQLSSYAQLEGYYYRPRIDLEMLGKHNSGLIATSACLGGPVANNVLHGKPEAARDYAGKLGEIFGRDRFFIELQDHGIADQLRVNGDLIALARSLDLPLVATNDVHYCNEDDATAQELLVCIQTNTTLADPKRLKSESNQLYLKSGDEMARLFQDVPEAISNTVRIAERCELNLDFRGYHLPEFPVPPGHSADSYLAALCEEGVRSRYGHVSGAVEERLRYELDVIKTMGFANYFLVVWDFVRFAKQNGILVGPGRGSAAASIVTYALQITALDPLQYDLIFERFLNPARISMPDIDIDFADDRRDEVIAYVVEKYGADRVAQIVTFGTLAAKAAVRDVGRAMGRSFADTDRVAKLIPTGPGITIESALEKVPELRAVYDSDDAVRELVDSARRVEGVSRHASTHAAGVVISRDPLVEHVPLQRAGGKSEGGITTQFPMGQLESLGLLKMDFLGLRTLTVLGKAIALLQDAGHDISLESIPLEDEKALQLLQRGETTGVFQLEAGSTTRMTVDVAPGRFEDLIALMALIRPGPMEMAPEYISRKHGRTEIEYVHPELEPILSETYGVALYQEQVIRIANVLAGFSMSEGDGLRKAMGKKLPEEMAKYRDRFVQGCVARGVDKRLGAEVFAMIERFAGYGFNKAHSAAYAVIAAQTAYLKAHFPVEFMAALLSSELGNTDRIVALMAECRRAGIAVLPPCINQSREEFSVEHLGDDQLAVRFGLAAVKNVGASAAAVVVSQRDGFSEKVYGSLAAFCESLDWSLVNRRAVESLARAGALDCLGERGAVLAALEPAIQAAQKRQRATAKGQMDLFGGAVEESAPPVYAESTQTVTARELLEWEKELLGVYMSDHPLSEVLQQARRTPDGMHLKEIAQLEQLNPGANVRCIAMIASVRRITTKSNRTMAVAVMEDLSGRTDLVLFPDAYERNAEALVEGAIVELRGRLDRRGEALQIVAESVTAELPTGPVEEAPVNALSIRFGAALDPWREIRTMQRVNEILLQHEGPHPVVLEVPLDRGRYLTLKSRSRKIEWSEQLERDLLAVAGVLAVVLQEPAPQLLAS